MRNKSKLERARLIWKIERIGRIVLAAVLLVKLLLLLEVIHSEDLRFIVTVAELILWVFVIAMGVWRLRWSKKLFCCPFCGKYKDKTAYWFLGSRKQQYICPYCGKQISVMDKEQE